MIDLISRHLGVPHDVAQAIFYLGLLAVATTGAKWLAFVYLYARNGRFRKLAHIAVRLHFLSVFYKVRIAWHDLVSVLLSIPLWLVLGVVIRLAATDPRIPSAFATMLGIHVDPDDTVVQYASHVATGTPRPKRAWCLSTPNRKAHREAFWRAMHEKFTARLTPAPTTHA